MTKVGLSWVAYTDDIDDDHHSPKGIRMWKTIFNQRSGLQRGFGVSMREVSIRPNDLGTG